MDIINVGIIGYGLSGRIFHGAVINSVEGYKITKVVTRDNTKIEKAKSDLKDVIIVESPEQLFDDSLIDIIVISTPNASHYKLAKKAMEAGKHVVIEKPFTVNSQEAEELIKTSKSTNRLLTVYHNRRFDSDFLTIKKVINEGKLGRIVEFESHFDRFRNTFKGNAWREEAIPGSGTLYDLGSHLIDQALNLFGMPEEVYGDIRAQRNGNVDDNFELILYYPELKVTLKASNLVKEEFPRFSIQGMNGSFMKYGLDVQENDLREGLRPCNDNWGAEPEDIWGYLNTEEERTKIKSEKGDYRYFYKNVYNAFQFGEALEVTGDDGLNVIRIIEASIKSNEEKRRISMK